jgi:hypothetical protein
MSLPDKKVEELLDISKTLANSKISTPFTIPELYFENFQIQLIQLIQTDHILIQNELSEIAPLLSKLEKSNPFSLPNNYFTSFNVKEVINNKIDIKQKSFNLFDYYKFHKTAINVAASFLLLVAATVWIYSSLQQKRNSFKPIELSQITQQEFNEFLIEDQEELPMEATEKEDIAENVFNIESTVSTLKEVELQQFLAELPESQSDQIN